MFNDYYGFANTPFCKGLSSSRSFLADTQEEALSRLKYVAENRLFGIVTGECGTGKTSVIRRLNESLDAKKYDFLYVADSKLTPRHFYNALLTQLGRDGSFYRGDCRRKLHQEIELIHGLRHRELVIVTDEAHLLDAEMLEEVRFLLNYKMDSESPLALILSGQPELEDKLEKRSSMAIRQRIDIRCRLAPLTLTETGEYVAHQLRYAGSNAQIFLESAIKEVFAYSVGSARLINKVCSSCLMYGLAHEQKVIDGSMVKEVIESEFK
jgi:type II secretory pathway predicted ATPase ExeA